MKGFTIVELMIAIAIVVLLAIVIIPQFNQERRDTSGNVSTTHAVNNPVDIHDDGAILLED